MLEHIGLKQFLISYPGMGIRPDSGEELVIRGSFEFRAIHASKGEVQDKFELRIEVPKNFPKSIPKVLEIGGRIPQNGNYHVNFDGSLCLGSPLRLLMKISESPDLCGFSLKCIIPYLFAISRKLRSEEALAFSELPHGSEGIVKDYAEILGQKNIPQTMAALKLLTLKKRLANKNKCPCGCVNRLGKCNYRNRLKQLRRLAPRSWFRSQYNEINKYLGNFVQGDNS